MELTLAHDEASELLGAYALDACEAEEAELVARHLRVCGECASEATRLRGTSAWLGATEALAPPEHLRAAVLRQARSLRDTSAAPGTPAGLLAEQVQRLEELLDALAEHEWAAVTATGWSVHEFVAHLLAGVTLVNWQLGLVDDDPGAGIVDWEKRTDVVQGRERPRPPSETRQAWRDQARLLVAHLAAASPGALEQPVEWVGSRFPLGQAATIHAFETWIHTDDIRRATGRPTAAPSPANLTVMSGLAASLVRGAFTGRDRGGTARLVLTGAGGGHWTLGPAVDESPTTVVTADAADFCTMVGGRLTPEALTHTVTGDRRLADEVLHTAARFSFA